MMALRTNAASSVARRTTTGVTRTVVLPVRALFKSATKPASAGKVSRLCGYGLRVVAVHTAPAC
jgi:hypothetical protein